MSRVFRIFLLGLVYFGLYFPFGGSLTLGPLFEPLDGIWATARVATAHVSGELLLEGMDKPVVLQYDDRGVPHIFAQSDKDATIALGYVVAGDRLFQMDFIHRAATGRLSEMMGEGALGTDLFFVRNGIKDAVLRNSVTLADRSPNEYETVEWYALGVNAYLDQLEPRDFPLEYRLLGATPPAEFTGEFTNALYAFMAYDLSFRTSDIGLDKIKRRLGEDSFAELYPRYSDWEKTIVPPEHSDWSMLQPFSTGQKVGITAQAGPVEFNAPSDGRSVPRIAINDLLAEGFIEGKGSNNWAVDGSRSTTGKPILAGDMHLGLSLPAIWYEAHIVTPTVNVYGVTFPSVPSIVEGMTPKIAWAFTNTGADQIDYYRLELNDERQKYLFDGEWLDLTFKVDSIRVKGSETIAETVAYSHHGPVLQRDDGDYAVKWVGHESGATFSAIWEMGRATNYEEFERAIRLWDYPMQNILYAGDDDIVAIRSTGYLPVRASGNAFGVLDGTTSDTDWIGRVPFDELPHSILPERGYLTSTNQRPAGLGYPHYLGQDWRSVYRSIRIDELLSAEEKHSPEQIASYQSDVTAVQARLFLPHIVDLDNLSDAGTRLQSALSGFDGEMGLDRTEPRLFSWFMAELRRVMWDEEVFRLGSSPKETRILELAKSNPESEWFDIVETPARETAADVFRTALEAAAARWEESGFDEIPFGETQTLQIRHLTRSSALRPLWREGYPFGGYAETLSPAGSNPVRWSASWRVVVDFSTSPPTAKGVYPGGQSGNPFSVNYDAHIQKYVDFEYYDIDLSASPR